MVLGAEDSTLGRQGLGSFMGQHPRQPLHLDHWMSTWVAQHGPDKRKLCSGVAGIAFWHSEMLLGMSPLRDSWFPWQCSHHCQSWKGLRESPGAAITGEFRQHLVAAGLFQSQMGHESSSSKATQATQGQQDGV